MRIFIYIFFNYSGAAYEPKQKEKRQKKGAYGFLAPLPLSDALVKFFGTGEHALSRADVVKRMWVYIKEKDLQVCLCCSLSFVHCVVLIFDNKLG